MFKHNVDPTFTTFLPPLSWSCEVDRDPTASYHIIAQQAAPQATAQTTRREREKGSATQEINTAGAPFPSCSCCVLADTMPPASILASPGPRRLPPRPPGRPPLLPTTSTRPTKTVRRAVSFSVELKTTQDTTSSEHAGHAQLQHALRQQQHHQPQDRAGAESAAAAALARRPALMRSLSLDMIDSSHIDPIEFARRRDRANSERAGDVVPQHHGSAVVPGNEYYEDGDGDEEDDGGDSNEFDGEVKKPERTDNSYSAEEIALRRFMTAVAWGPGMPVIKHNRGKGRVRRVLKFNDQVRDRFSSQHSTEIYQVSYPRMYPCYHMFCPYVPSRFVPLPEHSNIFLLFFVFFRIFHFSFFFIVEKS